MRCFFKCLLVIGGGFLGWNLSSGLIGMDKSLVFLDNRGASL